MRGHRALLLTLLGLAGAFASPGRAVVPYVVGIGDQSPAIFDDARFTGLQLGGARVIIPWNALSDASGGAAARAWLDRAVTQPVPVLVALDHARGVDCRDASPCPAPDLAEYQAAFAALVARYPQVEAWTPWNEPNHASEPTAGRPELAAAYYGAARAACPGCRLVAGDLLDGPTLASYWSAYRAALPEAPTTIGLHDYFDATYFDDAGVRTVLTTDGDATLWLTETGGIVALRAPGGGLPYDESRAADSVRWVLALPLRYPTISRVYLYSAYARPGEDFDGGLIGPGGAARPGYGVLAAVAGPRVEAPAGAAAVGGGAVVGAGSGRGTAGGGSGGAIGPRAPSGASGGSATPAPRVASRRVAVVGRRARVRFACVAAEPCRGTVRPGRGATVTVRVAAWRNRMVELPLSAPRAARVRRRGWLRIRVCDVSGACTSTRTRTA